MIDVARYSGRWYEIAHYPNWFESGEYATADYETLPGNEIMVTNTSYAADGRPIDAAIGRAVVRGPWELGVSFGSPVYAQYKIELVGADVNYGWAIVGNDRKSQLWILSRRRVTARELEGLIGLARSIGYDPMKLIVNAPMVKP